MATPLEHRQIVSAVNALSEAKIVNLDTSIKSLVDPLAESLARSGAGGEVGFHFLCCNEYFLVTGVQAGGIDDVERLAVRIRSIVDKAQKSRRKFLADYSSLGEAT